MTQKLLAEFVGTFTLILVAVSAICNDDGLVLVVMISAMGHTPSGHFNQPASLGRLVGGRSASCAMYSGKEQKCSYSISFIA